MSAAPLELRVVFDAGTARRTLRRMQVAPDRAARIALRRAAANVKRMEIALIRRGRTPSLRGVRLAPLDRAWRRLLHPGAPQGGVLTRPHLWRVTAPAPRSAEVDVVPGLRDYLARWERGGTERTAELARRLRAWLYTPAGRAQYHAHLVPAGWPPQRALPPTRPMPERDVRGPVERHAAPQLEDWYCRILDNILLGRSPLHNLARTPSRRRRA